MVRRYKAQPKISMSIWKSDGKLWHANPADLRAVLEKSGISEDRLKHRLGAAYFDLQNVLEGKRIDGWSVHFIELGLRERVHSDDSFDLNLERKDALPGTQN